MVSTVLVDEDGVVIGQIILTRESLNKVKNGSVFVFNKIEIDNDETVLQMSEPAKAGVSG
jgi:hypothetical protein